MLIRSTLLCTLITVACAAALADQFVDLKEAELAAANATLATPNIPSALLKCPAQVGQLSQAGARFTQGQRFTSMYGVGYHYLVQGGGDVKRLAIGIQTHDISTSKPLNPPKISCDVYTQ
jgi:hypothetical protein